MTTVSIVECSSPVSLRSCGSVQCSLPFKKRMLQSRATERTRRPSSELGAGLKGGASGLCISPLLQGRATTTPTESRHTSHVACSKSSTSLVRSFFPDRRTHKVSAEPCSSVCTIQKSSEDLKVVGLQPRIRSLYEIVPIQSSPITPLKALANRPADDDVTSERAVTSPDNPPPSPVNDQSLDAFVIGGKQIVEKVERVVSRINYSNRDFKPGIVKDSFHKCVKAAEQEAKYFRTGQHRSNRSPRAYHKPEDPENTHPTICPFNSEEFCFSRLWTHEESPCQPDTQGQLSFVEIFTKRKQEREQARSRCARELDWSEQASVNNPEGPEHPGASHSTVSLSSQSTGILEDNTEILKFPDNLQQGQLPRSCGSQGTSFGSSNFSLARKLGNVSDLSDINIMLEDLSHSSSDTRSSKQDSIHSNFDPQNFQFRRCWSDIWPFSGDPSLSDSTRDRLIQYRRPRTSESATDCRGIRKRCTPFVTLCLSLKASHNGNAQEDSSGTQLAPNNSLTESNKRVQSPPKHSSLARDNWGDLEMSNKTGPDWLTLDPSMEPQGPDKDSSPEECEEDMVENREPKKSRSIADVLQQFCYEAVVDKRYNRWKRRKRKRKDTEYKRSIVQTQSESSSDNEQTPESRQHRAVEQIIDHMYEEIHGECRTPNGSHDTPRIRNRRRRREAEFAMDRKREERKEKESSTDISIQGFVPVHYDASSECTGSDKDGSKVKTMSRTIQEVKVSDSSLPDDVIKTSPSTDEVCNWPRIEEYGQDITNTLISTPPDDLDANDQIDWLPPIVNKSKISISDEPDSSFSNGSFSEKVQLRNQCSSNTVPASSSLIQEGQNRPFQLWSKEIPKASQPQTKWQRPPKPTPLTSSSSTSRIPPKIPSTSSTSTKLGVSGIQEKCDKSQRNVSVVGVRQKSDVTGGGARERDRKDQTSQLTQKEFKPTLQPIKTPQPYQAVQKVSKPSPKSEKERTVPRVIHNRATQSLPSIKKCHPIIKTEAPKIPYTPSKRKEPIKRPKLTPNIIQPVKRFDEKSAFPSSLTETDLIHRDYYLRSMCKSSSNQPKGGKTAKITVQKIELPENSAGRKKYNEDEVGITNLSFTRSFTFSTFMLPQKYRDYNVNLMQKAVQVGGDSLGYANE